MSTAADLVIRELATSEHGLVLEARELAADAASYRELAHVALAEVSRLTRLLASSTRTVLELRAELRRYVSSQIGRDA